MAEADASPAEAPQVEGPHEPMLSHGQDPAQLTAQQAEGEIAESALIRLRRVDREFFFSKGQVLKFNTLYPTRMS